MDPPPPAVRLPPARGERDHQAAAAHQASAAPSAAAAAAAAAPAAAADHPAAAAAAAAAYPTPRQQQPQQTTQRQQQQQQQTTRRLQSTQRSSAQRSSGSSTSSSSTSSRPPEARLAFVHPLWPQVFLKFWVNFRASASGRAFLGLIPAFGWSVNVLKVLEITGNPRPSMSQFEMSISHQVPKASHRQWICDVFAPPGPPVRSRYHFECIAQWIPQSNTCCAAGTNWGAEQCRTVPAVLRGNIHRNLRPPNGWLMDTHWIPRITSKELYN